MKKFIGLILLLSVSIITMIKLGKIVAYDWPEIQNEIYNFGEYLDERLDDAGKFIDEKVITVILD